MDRAEQEALVAALQRDVPSAEDLAALLADLADDGPEDAACARRVPASTSPPPVLGLP